MIDQRSCPPKSTYKDQARREVAIVNSHHNQQLLTAHSALYGRNRPQPHPNRPRQASATSIPAFSRLCATQTPATDHHDRTSRSHVAQGQAAAAAAGELVCRGRSWAQPGGAAGVPSRGGGVRAVCMCLCVRARWSACWCCFQACHVAELRAEHCCCCCCQLPVPTGDWQQCSSGTRHGVAACAGNSRAPHSPVLTFVAAAAATCVCCHLAPRPCSRSRLCCAPVSVSRPVLRQPPGGGCAGPAAAAAAAAAAQRTRGGAGLPRHVPLR
jgi:hypothetical protein